MLLTLVDALRCPAHDEDSSLVLSVDKWSGERVSDGVLGCPVCHARYRIHRGAVDFAPGVERVGRSGEPVDPMRLAAQLSLSEPGGIILLTGRYAGGHDALTEVVETTLVLVDAAGSSSAAAVNIQVADRLPFVDRALRAAAVDGDRATRPFLNEVARCLRNAGRVVVPAAAPLPSGIHVIARDERELVGELSAVSRPVPLRREAPPSTL